MLESRILQVFAQSGLNRMDFAAKCGISNAVLSHISSGRNKASLDLVINILTQFPDINSDWLLFGNGEMTKSASEADSKKIKIEFLQKLKEIKTSTQITLEKINRIEDQLNAEP